MTGGGDGASAPWDGEALQMVVEYSPADGVGYMPVPCVTGLLRGTAAVFVHHAVTSPSGDGLREGAAFLRGKADEIDFHLSLAQVHAALNEGAADEVPPRRGGVFNPLNWFTRRP